MRPVEFKHGKPKESDCDRVQVCAQAICLEEMTGIRIAEASLFYRRIRRREEVGLNEDLRQKTAMFSNSLHELFNGGLTPPPVYDKRCKSCSFFEKCMPKKMGKKNRYRDVLFKPQEAE
jgi:CRISPR-associated exonuclease Cas4